jgi:hypothetical protein
MVAGLRESLFSLARHMSVAIRSWRTILGVLEGVRRIGQGQATKLRAQNEPRAKPTDHVFQRCESRYGVVFFPRDAIISCRSSNG